MQGVALPKLQIHLRSSKRPHLPCQIQMYLPADSILCIVYAQNRSHLMIGDTKSFRTHWICFRAFIL